MHLDAFLTIMGMSLATYATRVLGVWVISRLKESERLKRSIAYLPGSVLISIVLPPLFHKGASEALAATVTLISAIIFKNLIISMLLGMASIILFRGLF
jgi:uncharacterized membrane protein